MSEGSLKATSIRVVISPRLIAKHRNDSAIAGLRRKKVMGL